MERNTKAKQLISQHKGNITYLKTIPSTNNIITIGSDGQLHLYRKHTTQSTYQQISCLKLFQSAIVSCDVSKNQQKSIVVAAFSGEIKICRIVDGTFIIVEKQLATAFDSPITSCIWSNKPNHLVISTQLGSFFILDYKSNTMLIAQNKKSKHDLTLVRCGNNRIFLSNRNSIYEFQYNLGNPIEKNGKRRTILNVQSNILDFIVSDQVIFSTLAVLIDSQLIFYLLAQQPIKMSVFKLEQHSLGSKLGWGTNYNQLALYYCSQGKIKTSLFTKSLNGKWNTESKKSASIMENNGMQMRDIQ